MNAKMKRDKDAKTKKNGSIMAFIKQKPTTVPPTVAPPPLIHAPCATSGSNSHSISGPSSIPLGCHTQAGEFLDRFQRIAGALPESVPVGSSVDRLAAFGWAPELFDDSNIKSEDLWEERLNGFMKDNLGWGTEENATDLVRRGNMGMDGVLNFVRYFVKKRGVHVSLFEGKLAHLLIAAEDL